MICKNHVLLKMVNIKSVYMYLSYRLWLSNINSLKPNDAYMRQETNHHWFRQWLVS